jgi:hypothetical protein
MQTSRAKRGLVALQMLSNHPMELYDRIAMQASDAIFRQQARGSVRRQDAALWPEVLSGLSAVLGSDAGQYLREPQYTEIAEEVRRAIDEQLADPPFMIQYNADRRLAGLAYALCRMIKPQAVLETGVAYGVTSAFILKALAANGSGELHSIDLPPLAACLPGNERYVGILVPDLLRDRWRLHRGISKRELPRLLPKLNRIGLAVLDSRRTYDVKFGELSMIGPYLASRAAIVSDDVGRSAAFADWIELSKPVFCKTTSERDKQSQLGVSVHIDSSQSTPAAAG